MWEQFNHLGCYESNVIDAGSLSLEETVSIIKEKMMKKSNLLKIENLTGEWNDIEKEILLLVNFLKNKLEQILEADD